MRIFKRPSLFVLLILPAIFSCNTNIITEYTFGKTSVTRVDKDGLTNFYLGDSKVVEIQDSPCVSAEYYGRNNCMDAVLVFKTNQTVEIIPYGCGYFQQTENCIINIGEYRNDSFCYVLKSFSDSGYGVMRISDGLDLEKSFPENKDSKVSAHYK